MNSETQGHMPARRTFTHTPRKGRRRARILGGDKLFGGIPVGPGHAGRQLRPLLGLLSVLLVCVGMTPLLFLNSCNHNNKENQATYPHIKNYLVENLDPSLVGQQVSENNPQARIPNGIQVLANTGSLINSEDVHDTGQLIYVRYTLADQREVRQDETLDSVWEDPEHAAQTVWSQSETVTNVYDVGLSDYYVAFIDNTKLNNAGVVLDAAFAEHNTHGEALEGIIFDKDTGIAYIPHSLYAADNSSENYHPISAQLLLSYDFEADRTTVIDVTYDNKRTDLSAVAERMPVSADGLDVTYTVPIVAEQDADKITLSNLAVYLGDSERPLALQEGINAKYDNNTGELELLGSALTVSSIRIEILPDDFSDTVIDAISSSTIAYAAESSSLGMWPYGKLNNLDISKLQEGMAVSYKAPVKYDYNHNHFADIPWAGQMFWKTVPYVYTSFENGSDDYSVGSSNWVFQQIKNGTSWETLKDHISSTPVSASPGDINFMFALPGDNSVGTDLGGLDWSGLISPIQGFQDNPKYDTWINTVAFCSHITQPDNHLTIDEAYNDSFGIVTMRVLKIEPHGNNPYVIIGFCSPQVSTQSGIAVIKFGIQSQGTLSLSKESAEISITQSNPLYSLGGAEYGVYSDSACTAKVGTIVTDEAGSGKLEGLTAGTYYIREDKAPAGFYPDDTVKEVQITAGNTTEETIHEQPGYDIAWNLIQKLDSQLGATAQGSATLAGAQFKISHYGTSNGDISGTPLRTWILESDNQGRVSFDTATFVDGEPYQTTSGQTALPLGTYAIQEIKPPEGYLLTDTSTHVAILESNESNTGVQWKNLNNWFMEASDSSMQGRGISDKVQRGSVKLTKIDKETGKSAPLGAATLEGTTFTITYEGSSPIVVEGKTLFQNDLVMTIATEPVSTDEGVIYQAQTAENVLPVGNYRIEEQSSGEGYVLGHYETSFEITPNNTEVELIPAENPVIRGGLQFNKVDGDSQQALSGIPFLIVAQSDADGDGIHEQHLALTDKNGLISTEVGEPSNKNDEALLQNEDGSWAVDESKLDPDAGIWFSGRTDLETIPHNDRSALPFDTYTVNELPCKTNEGKRLVSFSVVISQDGVLINRGTITNENGPALATELVASDSLLHTIPAQKVQLTDTVSYEGLERGVSYEIKGRLVRQATGEALLDSQGNEIVVTKTFTASLSTGSIDMSFELDATDLSGQSIVAYETLYRDGQPVAEHEDLNDENQTVSVPQIATKASVAGKKVSASTGEATIDDLVTCSNLVPGEHYQLHAYLVDAESGDMVLENEEAVTATQDFVAEAPNETHQMGLSLNGANVSGKTLVVMEQLSQNGRIVAAHEDPTSQDQSVSFASIGTTLVDAADSDHHITSHDEIQLIDTVSYEGLESGTPYTLKGHLVDGQTGNELVQEDGSPLIASIEFVADQPSGTVDVTFSLPAQALSNVEKIVAFEFLYDQEGRELANHASLDDTNQTVYLPSIGTTLEEASSNKHQVEATESVELIDTVVYRGLEPGRSYQLTGTLMDAKTGNVLQDYSGKPITAEISFTPESSDGSEQVHFTFNANNLAGTSAVAFEQLRTEGTLVASHEDLADKNQTVNFIKPSSGARESVPKTSDSTFFPYVFVLAGGALLSLGYLLRKRLSHEKGVSRRPTKRLK